MNKRPPNRRFKDSIYDQLARIGKAVSSPKRLELLDLLCQGRRSVEALARETAMSLANTSQHLRVLREARLVEAEKRGLYVTCRLADPTVCDFYLAMRALAEQRLAEIGRLAHEFLEGRGDLEPVDRDALLERVRRGEVIVLDVRPPEEYEAGHIAGAVSIPLGVLRDRLRDFPPDREIVAYCRGPYCVMAVEAVELLRAHGFRAFRLEDGVADWRARNWPVEEGQGQWSS
jgi:rhodanese-related sulfurtransferase